jgi:Matrixin.
VSILALLLFQQCLAYAAPTIQKSTTKKKTNDKTEPIRWSTIQNARTLETEGRFKESLEVYRRCLNTKEFGMFSYIGMARCYAGMNDFETAEKTLIAARQKYKDHWSQKFILGDLADFYQRNGRLKELQAVRNEMLEKMPKKLTTAEREQFKYYEYDFERTKAYESNNSFGSEGKYPWLRFSQLPDMPIRLYIGSYNSVPLNSKIYTAEVLKNYRKLAQKAAEQWCSATDGHLKFEVTDEIEKAQIRCVWTAKKRGHSWAGGEERVVTDKSKTPQYSEAFIYLDNEYPRPISSSYSTCLHELGHALGLPHTSQVADIMYHTQKKEPWGKSWYQPSTTVPKLSQNDIRNVRQIYADPLIAADFAESFLRKSMIEQDSEKAYALLTDDLRKKITLSQFKSHIEPSADVPSVVFQVETFDRGKQSDYFHYGIIAKKPLFPEPIFFNVSVKRDTDNVFKVDGFSRVASEDLLGPRYPLFDDKKLWVVPRPVETRPRINAKKIEELRPKLESERKKSTTSPAYAALLSEMTELSANDEQWQDAINCCRDLLKLPPSLMPWSKGQTFRVIGYCAFMSQKDKEAEEACKQAVPLLEGNTSLIQPLRVLGDIYSGSGNLDGAQAVFKKLVEISDKKKEDDPPTYTDSLSKLADIYRRRKEIALAERTYSLGLDFWRRHGESDVPWAAKSLYGYALVLLEQGKNKEALKALGEARMIAREIFGPESALEGAIIRRTREASNNLAN